FGGLLFGKLALNPNLEVVENKPDRGKLLNKSWNRYNAVNALSVGTAIATWLISMISGLQLTRQAPDGATPIDSGVSPAPEMSEEAARLLRRVNVLGNVNIAVLGGVIAVSTILSMKANESVRWSLLSRLLP